MVAAYPAGGGALGNTPNYVTPPHVEVEAGQVSKFVRQCKAREWLEERRVRRYVLQATSAKLLPNERVSECLRKPIPSTMGKKNVDIRYSAKTKTAHVHNVFVCGSVWTCPVCAAKITEKRRVELAKAVANAKAKGLTPILVTLTMQHTRDDKLNDLLDYLNESFRAMRRGAPWKRIEEKWALQASVAALEDTWGEFFGWHPHKHVLFFSALPESELDPEALKAVLATRWAAILGKSGRYASLQYGVDVQKGNEQVGEYVGKWGLDAELTKAPVKNAKKGGYSPFQLLELYAEGQKWAGILFQEYAAAMKGRRQLVWGKGSRAVLGLSDQEATDEELAEEEQGESIVLVSLAWYQYEQVLKQQQQRPGIIGDLLRVAGKGDALEVWTFLVGLGVKPTQDQLDRALFQGCNTS